MICTGAPETCGGGGRITIWQNKGTVGASVDPTTGTPAPSVLQTYGSWAVQGCYV